MGNFVTVMVNGIMQEVVKQVKERGYDSYSFEFENNFTIDGIRNNPKCKIFVKKSSISAEELFVLNKVCTDENGRLTVDIKIPKIVLKVGKAGFTCNDPKFSCGAAGWIELVDSQLIGIMSMETKNNFKFDHVGIKPKVTEIKSQMQVLVNKKDYSELGNSVLRTKDPAVLNFILELVMKSYEESILEFLNGCLPEMQTYFRARGGVSWVGSSPSLQYGKGGLKKDGWPICRTRQRMLLVSIVRLMLKPDGNAPSRHLKRRDLFTLSTHYK